MGFWDNERCEYCGGEIVERRVELTRRVGRGYAVVEDVPAGVCVECGVRYFAGNVLKSVEEAVRGRRNPKRAVTVPVYSLSAGDRRQARGG